jgi:hypothetical protein
MDNCGGPEPGLDASADALRTRLSWWITRLTLLHQRSGAAPIEVNLASLKRCQYARRHFDSSLRSVYLLDVCGEPMCYD